MIETNEFAPPTDFETVAHGKYFFESSVRGMKNFLIDVITSTHKPQAYTPT